MINDRLWQLYCSINEWVRYADAKAGIALGAHAAVFTIAIPQIVGTKSYFLERPAVIAVVITALLFAALSVFFGIRCVLPRLKIGEARSLIFFAHIAEGYSDSGAFRDHAHQHYKDEDGFSRQVLDQIWANSRVAWRKHKDSTYCFHWLIAEFVLAVIGFVYCIFAK